MHHVLLVQVLHDVRQPIDDEFALVALQGAAFEVVGERAFAILEDNAMRLGVRVLVVVDQLNDELRSERFEKGHLAEESLFRRHELERHLARDAEGVARRGSRR